MNTFLPSLNTHSCLQRAPGHSALPVPTFCATVACNFAHDVHCQHQQVASCSAASNTFAVPRRPALQRHAALRTCALPQRTQRRRAVGTYPVPETEKERSSVDFPQEWITPQPSRRPDTQPEFEKLETPLPKKMPGDPEQPDEEEAEEEEKKKKKDDPEKEEGEKEGDPDKERTPLPDKE